MKGTEEEFSFAESLTCSSYPVKGYSVLRQGFVSEGALVTFQHSCV